MPRFKVLPYKTGSRSAKALATGLGCKVLKLEGSSYHSRPGDIVINWGNSNYPDFLYSTNLNCVPLSHVTNKLSFFQRMEDSGDTPPHWTDMEDIPDEAYPIVARTVLNGHSGVGIHIADTPDDLVEAPLYVKYIKKQEEYRVHIGTYGIILVQRKARRLDHHNPDWRVRNHANGFVYQRDGFTPPEAVLEASRRCFERTHLDFGAVDVIWNEHQQKAYVLEVNTAPGLEGSTVDDYVQYFKSLYT